MLNRRSFIAACVSLLASTPVVGKLFAKEAAVKGPVTRMAERFSPNKAMERLKKSIEFHRHMPTPPVGNGQEARDFYLSLLRKEQKAEWSGAEITYGNGSSRKEEWAHTFGQGPPPASRALSSRRTPAMT